MKKLLSLMLAMVIGLSICAAAHAEPVVINLTRANFNLQQADPDQLQKVEDAINAYIANKINVQIRLQEIGSDHYGDEVKPLLENGDIDLLWTASWEEAIGTNDLVAQGDVYDLTELLPTSKVYSTITETQWESTMYGEKIYFIPVYKDSVEGYDFMFRKDLADTHDWPVYFVKTLEDVEPMLEDAKQDGIKYPFLTQHTSMFYRWYLDRFDFFTADATTNFFAVDRQTDEVINTLQTPEYAAFAKLMGSWAEKGYVNPDDELNRVTSDTTMRTQDWAVSWWTDIPVNAEASSRYGQQVLVQRATNRYLHSTSSLGSCYCVSSHCTEEKARAALDFLGLLYTDRSLADLYTYGIEGEDFEYTQGEDQMIRHVTPRFEKYNHSMWESASVTIVSPLDNEPENKTDLYRDFNANAEMSIATGFRFDKTPVEDKYQACRELFAQYGERMEHGAVAPQDVDACIAEYQEKLDAAGYQDVLQEFQRQYNEWKAIRDSDQG